MFIQKIRDNEEHVAKLAIQQFGNIEKYTGEMKHNLEHFSEITEDLYSQILKLASHKGEDVASEPVQNIAEEIISGTQTTAPKLLVRGVGNYCRMIIDTYSNDYLSKVFGTKHGAESSKYIVKAFRYYSENNCTENN